MKPYIHALSSAKRFGGNWKDYIDIHDWFDVTKAWVSDNRHRAFRHHTQGIFECEQTFGSTRINSRGKTYSIRDIGEQHVLEDFGGRFIPTAQDYFEEMEYRDWMHGKGYPPSYRKLEKKTVTKIIRMD